jgi:hypothetical protein
MIFECKSNEQRACLSDVLSQQMKNKLLDVVKHPASFLNGIDNGSKIIVRQDNIRGVLGDIAARHSHRNTHVRSFQTWRVIHPVTYH